MSAPTETAVAPDAAPVAAPVQAPVQSSAPAHSSPISNDDVNHWKDRFNDVLSRPGDHINSRSPAGASQWSSSLFDCFSPIETCLLACYLPCIVFGRTHHRVNKSGKLEGYEPVNTSCLLFCIPGLHCILASMQRASIREKYNLEGTCIEDMAKSYCCACCNLIQLDKESAHREALLNNVNSEQYKSNTEGMTYPGAN
ncbi:PLAC8 domain-containing protein [Trichoderma evansii]